MLSPFATNESVSRLIRAAQAAPSILNTQPWLFCIPADDRIELRTDRTRHLTATDRRQREMVISCGAALFNLRMAIRVTGHDPVVWLVPDEESDPDLLASVEIMTNRTRPPTITEQRLYEAIPLRHTNREPFSRNIGLNMVAELEQAARMEVDAAWLLHRHQTRLLLRWTSAINRKLKDDRCYLDELRRWTGSGSAHGRGVPVATFGPLPKDQEHTPVRDLGLTWPGQRQVMRFKKGVRLIALATETDTRLDWMRAGQALQRLLLTATHYHVVASFLSQPFEEDDRHYDFTHPPWPWPWPKSAQIVVRLGFTPVVRDTPHEACLKVVDSRTGPPPSDHTGTPLTL